MDDKPWKPKRKAGKEKKLKQKKGKKNVTVINVATACEEVTRCSTPVINLEVQEEKVSAFVDTGSEVTLIKKSVLPTLGLVDRVRPCRRRLFGISRTPLKIYGQTKAKVRVSSQLALDQTLIVVPDEYLATDILMGTDLLGRAPLTWDGQKKDLYWGGVHYKVTGGEYYSVRKVHWEVLESTSLSSLHVKTGLTVQPGQIQYTRISHQSFEPGSIIQVDGVKTSKRNVNSSFKVPNSCFVVDEEGGFDLPIVNSSRGTLRVKPGRKIGEFTVIEEKDIVYLDTKGAVLGSKTEITQSLGGVSRGGKKINLCETHLDFKLDQETVELSPITECVVCSSDQRGEHSTQNTIRGIRDIDNALLPFSDESNVEGDRRTRLGSIFNTLDWSHLSETQQNQLRKLVLDNNELFILNSSELGKLKVAEAHLDTVDSEPVRMPLYRQPENARKIIATLIEDMLEKNIIEESTGVYLAPIVLVNKPDGSKRMCIDYRGVNKKIKMDIQPLPRLDEMVEDSAGKMFYCQLDMKDAYFQVCLDESSRDLTTFSDGLNLYRFKRLPFGLSVSPAVFTRKMQEVLRPLVKQGWLRNYLDDVVIWADSFSELLSRMQETFERLKEMGMKLNVSKCSFAMREIKFLGHRVSRKGVKPDPKNIEAVKNMVRPRSVKQVRRFIGMCNFYRKHIENFALIASPLTNLIRKDVAFKWNEECETAFTTLKNKLISAPVLVKADQTLAFEIHTDASDTHIGGALMQLEGKDLKPIGFYSKKLNSTEKRYSVTDREAMAIVNTCRFFSHYLWCKPFKIVTDHQPLTTVFKKRTHCPRMSRYILEMRDYTYQIVYKKGAQHTVPDMLSRPVGVIRDLKEKDLQSSTNTQFLGLTMDAIKTAQREDKVWTKLIQFLEGEDMPKKVPGNKPFHNFELINQVLYLKREEFGKFKSCLVVPKTLTSIACAIAHNESHLGEKKSIAKAKHFFYWPTLLKDVTHYVKSCKSCQQFKGHGSIIHQWRDLPPVEDNCQRVAIDLIDLHGSRAGYRYCLTVVDHFSRYLRIYPLRTKTTKAVAAEFKRDICRFGKPKLVIMDNGGEFKSSEFKEFCQKAGIKQGFTIPYHPRGNSVLERAHRTLKTVLAILSQEHPNTWPNHIHETEKALNEAVHTSLGTSPFFAFYGRHPNREVGHLWLPPEEEPYVRHEDRLDMKKILKETVQRSTQSYLKSANVKRKNELMGVGSYAWVYIEEPLPDTAVKLNRKWKGPYKIIDVVDGGRAYQLENVFDGTIIKRAAGKLKEYVERSEILDSIEERYLNEAEEREIQTDARIRRPPSKFRDYEM